MKPSTALVGGLAGACAITLIHETVKRVVPEPPRMDLLGMNAISKGLGKMGLESPNGKALFTWAMAGDIVSNALYYSLAGVGSSENVWIRSTLLGLTAGLGAVLLPGPLGLEKRHSSRTTSTKLMTIGLYVTGALVTTAILKLMERKKTRKNAQWEDRLVTSAMA